jgi:hypothetical protein
MQPAARMFRLYSAIIKEMLDEGKKKARRWLIMTFMCSCRVKKTDVRIMYS